MTKCNTCGQDLPTKAPILDALGREVKVTDVILWMKPVTEVGEGPITIRSNGPMGFLPIVVIPHETKMSLGTGCDRYEITGEGHNSNAWHTIHGEVDVKNPYIYRLTRSIAELTGV